MALKAAFIFLSPEGDPTLHNSETTTDSVSVHTFAVHNYAAACLLAKKLITENFNAIELCGGFGIEGVAAIKQAIEGKAPVGVVRFDYHPGLNFQSGDTTF